MSYAASTLATFANVLGAMEHMIGKAEKAGDPDLLDARLAPDMFAASTQVRMVVFQVLNALNRLAGGENAISAVDPADFAEARTMVGLAREAVAKAAASDFAEPGAGIEFDIPNGMEFALTAEEYVRDWVMAQLYFHATTFYAILRAQGLDLGKADFVGHMIQHVKR